MSFEPLNTYEREELENLRRTELDRLRGSNKKTITQSSGKFSGLSIAAIISCMFFAPLGIILGLMAISELNKTKIGDQDSYRGRGMATTSITLSLLCILIAIVFLINGYNEYIKNIALWNYNVTTTEAILTNRSIDYITERNMRRKLIELKNNKPKPPYYLFYVEEK